MNWLVPLLRIKCPKCHVGNMFVHSNMYSFKSSNEMYEDCPCCAQTMKPEPGFYYGAMYVSYALSVALFIPSFFITVYFDLSYIGFLIFFSIITLILSPYFFRVSRAGYLYMFVRYDKSKATCEH
jgi:hypothetical protein